MIRLFNKNRHFPERWFAKPKSAFQSFLAANPEYKDTQSIDKLRAVDFKRLDEQQHTYLDYTGGQLFGISQLKKHQDFLAQSILGNPHSINPSSALAEKHIQATRNKVLSYFNAGGDYVCVFTANASAALKIVGECYPLNTKGQFLMTADNHNSVNGIREFARSKNCPFTYSPLNDDLRINATDLIEYLETLEGSNKLFAFPAQSNVSGVKHSLNWVDTAQKKGWDVLLDAAAFAPSDRLNLQQHQPEFVTISFYKIFGYPTGLGALLIKKSVYDKLEKPSFAGGTITIVSVGGDGYHLEHGAARFEEGTLNYLEIPAIKTGLEYIEGIGIDKIKLRVTCLTRYLLLQLAQLKHSNGQPLVKVYGPSDQLDRGGTVVMNFFDSTGALYDFLAIEKAAFKKNISIRTGCFCNPGIDEKNHTLPKQKLKAYFTQAGEKNYFDLIEFMGKKRGAVRVSIGYISNFNDIEVFLDFCKTYLNKKMIPQD